MPTNRLLVQVIGDAASYVRSLERSGAATAAFGGELTQLSVKTEQSTKVTVAASMKRQLRLEQEAVAYKQLALAAAAGSREQVAAANLAARADARLLASGAASRRALGFSAAAAAATREARIGAARGTGRALTGAVTVPAAFVGYEGIKLNTQYAASLQRIVGLSGVAQSQVNKFRGEVLKLAPAVGKSPQELAEALYFITSSGIPASKAMDVLNVSAQASAAGLGETKVVADAVTSAVNAYGASNLSARQATDVLVAGVREGKGEASEFAGVIGNVAAMGAQLGVSFNDVVASLAAQTRLGIDPETASTQTQRVFSTLLKVTPKSEKAFEKVGLSAAGLRKELKDRGLLAMLMTVKNAFGNRTPLLAEAFGDVRGLRGVLALVGKQAPQTQGLFGRMQKPEGSLKTAFDAISKTDLQKFHQTSAQLQADAIRIGAALSPVVAKVSTVITKMLAGFDKLPHAVKAGFGGLIGVLAVGGPLLLGGAKVVTMIGKIRSALVVLGLVNSATAVEGELAGIGTSAGAASTKVGLLRTRLTALGALSIAAITIPISIEIIGKEKKWLEKHAGRLGRPGKALLDVATGSATGNVITDLTGWNPGGHHNKTAPFTGGTPEGLASFLVQSSDPSNVGRGADLGYRPAGGTGGGGTPAPAKWTQLILPYNLRLQEATARNQAQDMAASKAELAYVNRMIASGRLAPKALLDAYRQRRQLADGLAQAEKDQKDKLGQFTMPGALQVSQARADALAVGATGKGPTAEQVGIARRVLAAAIKAIHSHHLSMEGLVSAWNAVGQARGVLTQKPERLFAVSTKLQLAQARADALAAGMPNQQGPTGLQLQIARQVKAAALKAIRSHHLSMQGMIDAWNAISQANQTLAQKASSTDTTKTYKLVSLNALEAGLGLKGSAKKLLHERLAQAQAHGGYRPTGPAAQGQVVHIDTVHVHGAQNVDELYGKLGKVAKKRGDGRRGHR